MPLLISAVLLFAPWILSATWALSDPSAAASLVPGDYSSVTEPRPAGQDLGLSAGRGGGVLVRDLHEQHPRHDARVRRRNPRRDRHGRGADPERRAARGRLRPGDRRGQRTAVLRAGRGARRARAVVHRGRGRCRPAVRLGARRAGTPDARRLAEERGSACPRADRSARRRGSSSPASSRGSSRPPEPGSRRSWSSASLSGAIFWALVALAAAARLGTSASLRSQICRDAARSRATSGRRLDDGGPAVPQPRGDERARLEHLGRHRRAVDLGRPLRLGRHELLQVGIGRARHGERVPAREQRQRRERAAAQQLARAGR